MKAEARSAKREGWAFIALGSNQGNSPALVLRAMERLQALSNHPLRRSSLWRSSPVDCPPGSPDFVNAAVALVPRAGETPETLLLKLQFIEAQFGRVRGPVQNSPRPLDLDLIAFGAETRRSGDLTLPHPRAHLRRFVLAPLAELAPDFILPGQTRTVAEQLARLNSIERAEPLGILSARDESGRGW